MNIKGSQKVKKTEIKLKLILSYVIKKWSNLSRHMVNRNINKVIYQTLSHVDFQLFIQTLLH